MKKLTFIPNSTVHPHLIRFPICFVVSEEQSNAKDINFPGIPPIWVYANTAFETQLPEGINFQVEDLKEGCLQVRCRVDRNGTDRANREHTMAEAIKAVLVAFNPNFEEYEVIVVYEVTTLTDDERRDLAKRTEEYSPCTPHLWIKTF
jgi:hypothetical protein